MSITMTKTITSIYTARPFATVDLTDETDGATLEALATALDADARALGPACAYDSETHQLSAIYQVTAEGDPFDFGGRGYAATQIALEVFATALQKARIDAHTAGWSIVEGHDPELLP